MALTRLYSPYHFVPAAATMSQETLLYSVSSGSAFNAFDKLQGTKNYTSWKDNMETVLLSLWQWSVVVGKTTAPIPMDPNQLTAAEVKAREAWEVWEISAFMEISFRIANSAKTILGVTQSPKAAWEILERHFGAKQEGLQETLNMQLLLAQWDGTGPIHTHRDYMVNLQIQLADAGLSLSDQSFYSHFVRSLPKSLNMFIALYEDMNYDVDFLCAKFTKYEMWLKLHKDMSKKDSKSRGTAEGSIALFGQSSADKKKKGKKKQDLTNITCFGCGKKGHLWSTCKEKKEMDKGGKDAVKNEVKGEAGTGKTPLLGTLYTAMSHTGLSANRSLTSLFNIDSGASDHLVPSRSELCAYQEFATPIEIAAADSRKFYAYGVGTLQIMSSVNGLERQQELEDVYYAPGVHVRLVSLGKLKGQGWGISLQEGRMELQGQEGDMFASVEKVNNVYPMEASVIPPWSVLAAWTDEDKQVEMTHDELIQHLEMVALAAMARGGNGMAASLMT